MIALTYPYKEEKNAIMSIGDDKMIVDDDNDTSLDTSPLPGETPIDEPPAYPVEAKLECPLNDSLRGKGGFEFKVEDYASYPPKADVKSEMCNIAGLPWKLMVYPAGNGVDSIGVFLEFDYESLQDGEDVGDLYVHCKLEVISSTDPRWNAGKVFHHKFIDPQLKRQNMNWGYKALLPLAEVRDPLRGYIDSTGAVTIRATALLTDGGDPEKWLELSTYDSYKKTKMVGLRNQGMTCYMNSVLQTLFHTAALRRGVYLMPTQEEPAETSVALGIQRVFFRLQTSTEAVSTQELTKSFGWNVVDSFMQHDVQEFLRVLIDKMEEKMKSTPQEKLLEELFGGKMKSYIKCTNVDYESSRDETYLDIQLTVKGMPNLEKSFEDYCEVEMLDGDNKYQAEGHGLQDAKKGVIFKSFPPVLNLQLRRFEYNMIRDESYKVNDRFEFQEHINLDKFLEKPEDTPADYTLHSVLVQGGDTSGGHYIAFIRPDPSGHWYKFDDEHCVRTTPEAAIEGNFGLAPGEMSRRGMSNAYMLVYIRDSVLNEIVKPVTLEEIPQHLQTRFAEEEEQNRLRELQEFEAHNMLNVIVGEIPDLSAKDNVLDYPNLYLDFKNGNLPDTTVRIKVPKEGTETTLYEAIADKLKIDPRDLKIFPVEQRENKTTRPGSPLNRYALSKRDTVALDAGHLRPNMKILGGLMYLNVFVLRDANMQLSADDVGVEESEQDHALIICKFFSRDGESNTPRLRVVTHAYPHKTERIGDYTAQVFKAAGAELIVGDGADPNENVEIREELAPLQYPKCDPTATFDSAGLQHGDVLVWSVNGANTEEFLFSKFHERKVEFRDLDKPTEPGFFLTLDGRSPYVEVAKAVAQVLDCNPRKLQFTTHDVDRIVQQSGPSEKISSKTASRLNEIFYRAARIRYGVRPGSILYYQKIEMDIDQLEDLEEVVLHVVDDRDGFKLNRVVLHCDPALDHDGFIQFATEKLGLDLDINRYRLSIVHWNKIQRVIPPKEQLMMFKAKHQDEILRLEPIPEDQMDLDNESVRLVQVSHMFKIINRTHGDPFLFLLKDGESYTDFRARMQEYLKIPKAEFDKWKIGIAHENTSVHEYPLTNVEYFKKDDVIVFKELPEGLQGIVLDHADKSHHSYGNSGGAIKIHN